MAFASSYCQRHWQIRRITQTTFPQTNMEAPEGLCKWNQVFQRGPGSFHVSLGEGNCQAACNWCLGHHSCTPCLQRLQSSGQLPPVSVSTRSIFRQREPVATLAIRNQPAPPLWSLAKRGRLNHLFKWFVRRPGVHVTLHWWFGLVVRVWICTPGSCREQKGNHRDSPNHKLQLSNHQLVGS